MPSHAVRHLDDIPEYPMLIFNLACCESFLGQTSEAIDHVRQAIAISEEFRQSAREDPDLDGIRGAPAFQELVRVRGIDDGAGDAAPPG